MAETELGLGMPEELDEEGVRRGGVDGGEEGEAIVFTDFTSRRFDGAGPRAS